MKYLFILAFLVSYFDTVSGYAQTCQNLFADEVGPKRMVIESLRSQSNRVELQRALNSTQAERLTLEPMDFSKNVDEASIELMRLLLQNSSYILEEKNVLTKNELTIGVPVKNGYFFEVTYKALANERGQFVIDKISLKTATGAESRKVAEGMLMPDRFELKKSEFELGPILGAGVSANLKIPLVIDGPLLNKLDHLARFFEFFRKDEMRLLLQSNSMLKIRSVFEYRRAKDIFTRLLFKEPMKGIIAFGFLVTLTANPISLVKGPEQPVADQVAAVMPRDNANYLQDRINGFRLPQNSSAIKHEIAELNNQITSHYSTTNEYSGPKFSEILLDKNNAFSQAHKTWVFEKVDPYNKSVHTYIVFAEEKVSTHGPGLQYMVLEVDATKYPELIKFIKNQGQIVNPQNKMVN